MLKLIYCALTLAMFSACFRPHRQAKQNNETQTMDSVVAVRDLDQDWDLYANGFSEIDSSGILMLPLSLGEREGKSKGSYKSRPSDNNYWNIVFYNTKSDSCYLLSDSKMLITGYHNKYSNLSMVDIDQTANQIFYTIITDDYNKDGELTEEDPAYLFATDKAGKHWQQLSPSGYHLTDWQYVKAANKILMTVRKDSDGNKYFDSEDEKTVFGYVLGKSAAPTEIFSEGFKKNLQLAYSKYWKKPQQ
jgi:hypothetical protein